MVDAVNHLQQPSVGVESMCFIIYFWAVRVWVVYSALFLGVRRLLPNCEQHPGVANRRDAAKVNAMQFD